MDDRTVRVALGAPLGCFGRERFKVEHEKPTARMPCLIIRQSGERIRGQHNIQGEPIRPAKQKRFTVRRIISSGDLWPLEIRTRSL